MNINFKKSILKFSKSDSNHFYLNRHLIKMASFIISTSMSISSLATMSYGLPSKNHQCQVDQTTKSIQCQGDNEKGQLGVNKSQVQLSDDWITIQSDHQYTKVVDGENFSCGLRISGIVDCWGENNYDPTIPTDIKIKTATPQPVLGEDKFVNIKIFGNELCLKRTHTSKFECPVVGTYLSGIGLPQSF